MCGIFNSKFPAKLCACADSRHKFVPANLQPSVTNTKDSQWNYIYGLLLVVGIQNSLCEHVKDVQSRHST